MVTMKDVARLAGVSHGTVSNVINGVEGVRIEKIKKVEDAIKQLGYKPNALARNLKTSKIGNSIYVIMPSITDSACRDMFDGINRKAEQHGYDVNLFLTNEHNYREKKAITRAQMYNADGAIIITCQPHNSDYFNKIKSQGFNLVFMSREVEDMEFVGIDVKSTFINSINNQIDKGARKISLISGPKEYSFETECVEGYLKALFNANIEINNNFIKVTDFSKESAMRATISLLNSDDKPEVIYITNDILAEGVRKAILLTLPDHVRKPKIITIGSPTWTRIAHEDDDDIVLPYGKMGEKAFTLLMDKIENNNYSNDQRIIIPSQDENTLKKAVQLNLRQDRSRKIKVLLQEGQIGHAVKALSNDFMKRTGIDVEIDLKSYRDMLKTIKENKETKKYDVFAIDLPWTKELIHGGYITPLDKFITNTNRLYDTFQKNIFREYCYYEDNIYSFPYSYTVQMLYYRKDLFEKVKNKRLYYEMYKEELKLPTNWKDYNKVARFFTRKYNPDSDTLYGTTLGGKVHSGSVCEFLPRLWSFGGSVFDQSSVTINNHRSLEALKNYIECFEYAPEGSQNWWWDEEAREFCSGSTAMMVLFSDHATVLRDRNSSRVVGTTGHSAIPGEISVLGGWSIAISSDSSEQDAAYEFLKWSILEELAMPNAALGRVLPYKSICENNELANFYPWHKDTFRLFGNVGKRILPNTDGALLASEEDYERIIADSIFNAITHKISPEDALQHAEFQLNNVFF
jgi:DNA-binding LacI/PurR family transcriptional regulator/ABC-type glycerol-3-phosphate transport system substrate-binding protein